jgi:hypothetical protein
VAERQCPLCHRMHEVADDGTIPTWQVTYAGKVGHFIHKEDAEAEYNSTMRHLKEAGVWEKNKGKLTLEEGERALWSELFEEPGIGYWEA